jgi:hypothetical protein
MDFGLHRLLQESPISGSIDNYVTGVSERSQQRGNLKDDGYKISLFFAMQGIRIILYSNRDYYKVAFKMFIYNKIIKSIA